MSQSPFRFAGKRVLISGMSRGIGRGLGQAFASHGAHVFGVARDLQDLQVSLQSIRSSGGKADVLSADLSGEHEVLRVVAAAVETMGGIDVLVNNAAADHESAVLDTDLETWDRVVGVNLRAPFLMCREAGQYLQEGGGKVINMASMLAEVALRGNSAYIASKSGLVGFSRALALEWADKGVQVNSIAPGFIRTEMTESLWGNERGRAWAVKRTPMRRWGEVSDVEGAALFLASSGSDFMTGQTLVVDGGWTLR